MKIFKYECPTKTGKFTVEGQFVRLLNFDTDLDGNLCFWALVDATTPKQSVDFYLAWTGKDLPNIINYVGTCKAQGLVWHLFTL